MISSNHQRDETSISRPSKIAVPQDSPGNNWTGWTARATPPPQRIGRSGRAGERGEVLQAACEHTKPPASCRLPRCMMITLKEDLVRITEERIARSKYPVWETLHFETGYQPQENCQVLPGVNYATNNHFGGDQLSPQTRTMVNFHWLVTLKKP
eukprot:scaffold89931_cov35-Prasinocladus_malaysianus.AAC.2